MQIVEEILKKTDGKICKHCLGRMLSKTIDGKDLLHVHSLEFFAVNPVRTAEIRNPGKSGDPRSGEYGAEFRFFQQLIKTIHFSFPF